MWNFNLKQTAVRAIATSVVLMCLAAACQTEDSSSLEPSSLSRAQAPVWVAIEPKQCLSNAWEMDWLARHHNDYAAYPKDRTLQGLGHDEITIITSYYKRQGVVVSDTAAAPKFAAVCAGCACPEGHTLFLRVRADDVDTMIGFGYRVEAPPTGI
jgi:hypothetical protein